MDPRAMHCATIASVPFSLPAAHEDGPLFCSDPISLRSCSVRILGLGSGILHNNRFHYFSVRPIYRNVTRDRREVPPYLETEPAPTDSKSL